MEGRGLGFARPPSTTAGARAELERRRFIASRGLDPSGFQNLTGLWIRGLDFARPPSTSLAHRYNDRCPSGAEGTGRLPVSC